MSSADRPPAGRRAAIPPEAAESRRLPTFAANAVDVPYTMQGAQEIITRDIRWADHSHPTHELLWNERGASTARIGSRVWTITPVAGLWIPAGVVHSGFTPAGVWHRAAQLSASRTAPLAPGPVAVDLTDLLRLLLDRHLMQPLSDRSRSVTEAMILDVLAPAEHELLLHVPENPLLQPIVETARADPGTSVTLRSWAGRLGVSERTITRAFETETGMSYRTWTATARAQRAAALLTTGEPIDEVAGAVGYRSASAFTTAFRRTTGLTPGTFRRAGGAARDAVVSDARMQVS